MVATETVDVVRPSGVLAVKCPAACGATLYVPVEIADTPSVGSDAHGLDVRFIAEAPELHDCIDAHLRICPAASTPSAEAPLHKAAG